MLHVPYRGAGPALNDLIPGRVDVMFNNIGAVMPLIQSGKLRALGVTTLKRAGALPDVPTDRRGGSCRASTCRPGTRSSRRPRRRSRSSASSTPTPSRRWPIRRSSRGWSSLASAIVGSTPEELGAHLKREMDKWGVIIKEAGIKGEG